MMSLPDLIPLRAKLDCSKQAFFRFRKIADDRVLITNLEGRWLVLSSAELERFATGDLEPGSELEQRLASHNFLRASYDQAKARETIAKRKQFLKHGPNLHVFVVTLRCNETCVYCHASRADMDAVQTDM
ncbi:MAG: hypothetical protein IT378_15290, partial [Sandaracinaceae bacterium]|nr:hypothetical protein [Sandaracinaceae bacterium]